MARAKGRADIREGSVLIGRSRRQSSRCCLAGCLRGIALLVSLAAPGAVWPHGGIAGCPADFASLRASAEQVRNPTVRASALELVGRSVALSIYRAGGLDGFLARQRALIEEWRAFPPDPSFEDDRASMIALYQGMIDIVGCVPRKGDPRQRVDRQDAGNRRFASVAAIRASGRDERPMIGSGVLVSACHVLTSQHVVFGDGPPKHGQPVTVLLGETPGSRRNFATRLGAAVVGYSHAYWPDAEIAHDWVLLRLARRVDDEYPAVELLPRGEPAPDRSEFALGKRSLTVAGFPGEKLIEGGGVTALWRHAGCHALAAAPPIGGWATTCAMNPGQSGGPVLAPRPATDGPDDAAPGWQLVGLATAMSSASRGIVDPGETDALHANLVTPLVGETLEEIYQLIDTYSCDR